MSEIINVEIINVVRINVVRINVVGINVVRINVVRFHHSEKLSISHHLPSPSQTLTLSGKPNLFRRRE